MTTIPYENAQAGERALAECQRLLAKLGCQRFGTMTDVERGCTMVQFTWHERQISLEASWKGYAAAWMKAHPYKGGYSSASRGVWERKALEIGKTAVASVLRDWLKGQCMAIECGVLSFDSVFMAHMLLPDGQRLIDRAQQMLPPAEPPKVVEFKP
jgi:hypothetical protein